MRKNKEVREKLATNYEALEQLQYVLMIGVTLSGKTTHSRKNYPDHEYVSLTAVKSNRKLEMSLIEEYLKLGKSVVIDDTNLTRKIRQLHIDLARKYNAKIIGIHMKASRDLLARRRWKRSDIMDMAVINKMLKDLEIPEKNEGFDELYIISNE